MAARPHQVPSTSRRTALKDDRSPTARADQPADDADRHTAHNDSTWYHRSAMTVAHHTARTPATMDARNPATAHHDGYSATRGAGPLCTRPPLRRGPFDHGQHNPPQRQGTLRSPALTPLCSPRQSSHRTTALRTLRCGHRWETAPAWHHDRLTRPAVPSTGQHPRGNRHAPHGFRHPPTT